MSWYDGLNLYTSCLRLYKNICCDACACASTYTDLLTCVLFVIMSVRLYISKMDEYMMMTAWQMSKQIPVQLLRHDFNHYCIRTNNQMVDFFLWLVRIFCCYSLECCDQTSRHVSQLYTWSDWKGPRHPKANDHLCHYVFVSHVCVIVLCVS